MSTVICTCGENLDIVKGKTGQCPKCKTSIKVSGKKDISTPAQMVADLMKVMEK